MNNHSLTQIKKILLAAKNPLLIGHQDPDGDSLGGVLALNYFYKYLNKKPLALKKGSIPPRLQFFDAENVLVEKNTVSNNDIVIIVDCSSLERTGFDKTFFNNKSIVNIDHHPDNTFFGDFNYVQPQASSVCELLFSLLQDDFFLPQKTIALLLGGLLYDTGGLKHPNLNQNSMQLVTYALIRGCDLAGLQKRLFNTIAKEDLILYQKALARIEFFADSKIVSTFLVKGEGGEPQNISQRLIEDLRNIIAVELAIVFIVDQDFVKVSLRSSSDFPAHQLAAFFEGGGHQKAAGLRSNQSLEEIKTKILAKAEEILNERHL